MEQNALTHAVIHLIETGTAGDLAHTIGEQIGEAVAAAVARAMSSGPESVRDGRSPRQRERDRLAELAMLGLCANPNADWSEGKLAQAAYSQADAMLAERDRKPEAP